MTLQILNFKNYTDRICNRLETVNEYRQYALHELLDIQFNMGDGIRTTQIVNVDLATSGNYLVVSENNVVLSRWYIMETDWLRMGQVRLHLKRDVIDDYILDIKDKDFIIKRGLISPDAGQELSPEIFNDEAIKVNRVRAGEVLIKENTNSTPYIIAYTDKTTPLKYSYSDVYDIENIRKAAELPFGDIPEIAAVFTSTSTQQPTYSYQLKTAISSPIVNVYANAFYDDGYWEMYKYSYRGGSNSITAASPNIRFGGWQVQNDGSGYHNSSFSPQPADYLPRSMFSQKNTTPIRLQDIPIYKMEPAEFNSACQAVLQNRYQPNVNEVPWEEIREALGYYFDPVTNTSTSTGVGQKIWGIRRSATDGTVYYDYYRFTITLSQSEEAYNINSNDGAAFNTLYNNVATVFDPFEGQGGGTERSGLLLLGGHETVNISLNYLGNSLNDSKTIEPGVSERHPNSSGLYDIIFAPYTNGTINTANSGNVSITAEDTLRFFQALAEINSAAIYDIQIVPYGPRATEGHNLVYKQLDNLPIVACIGATDRQPLRLDYAFQIPRSALQNGAVKDALTDIDVSSGTTYYYKEQKIHHMTDMFRICDPGYNGVFEFSAAANDGFDGINVYVNLRPYNPFIHVAPMFGGLYATDDELSLFKNDPRGLTCGSNFSVTTKSDAWATYELNNKNYQQMFNRQIQNLEVTHDIQDTQQIWNAVSGTLGGAVSGTATGAMSGNPIAAVAGGLVGGIGSAVTGVADYNILQDQQAEQLAYTKDMFNFQLDNIKALPDSITRIGQQSQLFRYFPYIEYYTCTAVEREIVDKYLTYNSMTINAINKLGYYIDDFNAQELGIVQFIQAIPIRMNINEATDTANEIGRQLSRGIYVTPSMAHKIAVFPYTPRDF